jgi:predicted phosphodiesterase
MKMPAHIEQFDVEHDKALRSIWFCGDVHGDFRWLGRTLFNAAENELPKWIVLLGDVDCLKPLDEYLLPLRRNLPSVQVAYIPGNHDSDNYDAFGYLKNSSALNLHGKVTELAGTGIRVAGLGGVFLGRVWYPPDPPKLASQDAAMMRGAFQYRGGQRPSPTYLTAIYPDVYDSLAKQQADILITHEAPSCHPNGFESIDVLALDMKVKRTLHGHHHDDLTATYRKTVEERGFDAVGVNFCAITIGLGEQVYRGPEA